MKVIEMGIKGLTSFVENNSNSLMKNYELHDTDLVIDGESTAYQLYCHHFHPKNCCFTGDYDRYGMSIRSFFDLLIKCNIRPILIFDGGYDDRKMNTIENRMKDRIRIAGIIDTVSKDTLFPLFLGELFKDIATEYKFPVIRCDYEGDLESANIARTLNCPVLSNDSDFYIFGVQYIPFSSLKLQTVQKLLKEKDQSYFCIPCQLYQTEKFLNFINLTKNKLPLFATLLGNDYIDRKNLSQLFGREINDRRFGSYNRGFRYIEMLASWLRQEKSTETAIEKVLRLRNFERDTIAKDIQETMNGYVCKNSKYLKYLNTEPEFDEICSEALINSKSNLDKNFLKNFLNSSRKCLYPSCFINMLIQNTYYIRPQVEDPSLDSTHKASIEVISIINQILKNSTEQLRFYTRIQNDLGEQLLPLCSVSIPTYLEIQNMALDARKKLFLNLLDIKESFIKDSLNYFPDSWQLYLLSIKYLCDKSAMSWSIIQPILLCKLILEYVDKRIGYYRCSKSFNDKYRQDICKILIARSKTVVNNITDNLQSSLESISYEDSLIAQKNLISFFEMKPELRKSSETFNRKIVHAASQFQSVFYHIGFLNSLCKSPFKMSPMSYCFNGTFIYNMTSDLRSKSDENYIAFLLQNAPGILGCFNCMVGHLKKHIDVSFLPTNEGFNI